MLDRDLQHPDITSAERTGYPYGKEPVYPRCPVCGEECEIIYRNERYGDIIGCDVCIMEADPWYTPECFPETEPDCDVD